MIDDSSLAEFKGSEVWQGILNAVRKNIVQETESLINHRFSGKVDITTWAMEINSRQAKIKELKTIENLPKIVFGGEKANKSQT